MFYNTQRLISLGTCAWWGIVLLSLSTGAVGVEGNTHRAALVAPHLGDLLASQGAAPPTPPTADGSSGFAFALTMGTVGDGKGMHARLQVDLTLLSVLSPLAAESDSCNLLVVFTLPSGCYADVEELARRHNGFNWRRGVIVHAFSPTSNPELMKEEAHPEVLGVEFLRMPLQQEEEEEEQRQLESRVLEHSFTLPVHLRYHRATSYAASGANFANVSVFAPAVYLCLSSSAACREHIYSEPLSPTGAVVVTSRSEPMRGYHLVERKNRSVAPSCLDQLGHGQCVQEDNEGDAVTLSMPVGNIDLQPLVASVTWATLVVTSAALCVSLLL